MIKSELIFRKAKRLRETGYGSGKWSMDNVWHGL